MAEAKYKQIAEDLGEQILSGRLQPGAQLPTETQLAASYGASRSTIRLAVGLLIHQGLVETRQGLGTYVAEPVTPLTVELSREEDWRSGEPADTALQPTGEAFLKLTPQKFQAELAAAHPEVAAALELAGESSVVVRRTYVLLGNEPWAVVESPAIPPRSCAGQYCNNSAQA